MMSQELITLFAEALEVEPSTLDMNSKIADVAEWNSLAWLTTMSLLDERFSVQLTAKEIRGFVTVQDVVDNLLLKASSAAAH